MKTPLWSFKTRDLWYFIFTEHRIFKWLLFPKADDRRELRFWFVFHISSCTQSNTWQDGVAVTQGCLWHLAFSLTLQQLTQPGHKEASLGPYVSPYGLSLPQEEALGLPKEEVSIPRGSGSEKAQRPSADTRARAGAATRSWLQAWEEVKAQHVFSQWFCSRAKARLGPDLNTPRGFIKFLSFTSALIILYRGGFHHVGAGRPYLPFRFSSS